jgi:hypothetical protein
MSKSCPESVSGDGMYDAQKLPMFDSRQGWQGNIVYYTDTIYGVQADAAKLRLRSVNSLGLSSQTALPDVHAVSQFIDPHTIDFDDMGYTFALDQLASAKKAVGRLVDTSEELAPLAERLEAARQVFHDQKLHKIGAYVTQRANLWVVADQTGRSSREMSKIDVKVAHLRGLAPARDGLSKPDLVVAGKDEQLALSPRPSQLYIAFPEPEVTNM